MKISGNLLCPPFSSAGDLATCEPAAAALPPSVLPALLEAEQRVGVEFGHALAPRHAPVEVRQRRVQLRVPLVIDRSIG